MYNRVNVVNVDHGSLADAGSRRLIGPRARVFLFVVAQPATTVFWSLALHFILPSAREVLSDHPYFWSVLIFFSAASPLVIFMFPLGLIDLAAGFLFGLWTGLPLGLATKVSGSVLCFLISRYTCSSYLRRTLVDHYSWLAALSHMMKDREFRTMALIRFSAIPGAVKNYGCGSLPVSLRVFTAATALALVLETVILVPIGARFESLTALLERKQTLAEKAGLALSVLLLLALVLAVRRTVKREIALIQHSEEDLQEEEYGLRGGDAAEDGFDAEVDLDKGLRVEHAVF